MPSKRPTTTLDTMSVSNPQTPRVETGQDGRLQAFRVTDFQYTTLGMFIIYRLLKDRDVKIVITSKGTTTGTGKSQLAILLARTCHRLAAELFGRDADPWQADERAFLEAGPYIDAYLNSKPGDVFIVDELEIVVDNRRSMSNRNLEFSHAWQKLRDRNNITITTAPGLHSLDKRVGENSDIWINVVTQGKANTYYLTVHDFEGYRIPVRLKKSQFKECLYWLPIDDDPDYAYLQSLKHDTDISTASGATVSKEDVQAAEREARQDVALRILEAIDQDDATIPTDKPISEWSQMDIGKLVGPGDGWTQQTISKLKREQRNE